ncbi:hypothetical protein MFLAVUS_006412 [Mucor flavus]|uniref:BTB domain-containing protein n=1 Tax=Mucor flavus TaxID=439312 RepID=A0ABP9Z1H5_9FUNG
MSARDTSKRHDLSLTLIYQSLQSPTSSTSVKCRTILHTASVKQLDHTLRKLKSYTKRSEWPARRLMRCLDYLFVHGMKSSPHLQSVVRLPSFRSCVKWGLLCTDTDDVLPTAKFFCNLLETAIDDDNTTVLELKRHGVVKLLLEWTQLTNQSVRTYSVRALAAKIGWFAKDLIALDAYSVLTRPVLNVSELCYVLSLKPPVSDIQQKRVELEQCIMACKLLDSIFKYEQADQPSAAFQSYAESNLFLDLVATWRTVCFDQFGIMYSQTPHVPIKNEKLLVYCLSSIVQRFTCCCPNVAEAVARPQSRSEWQPYFKILMQTWIRNCAVVNKAVETEKRILKKMIQIAIDIVPAVKAFGDYEDYAEEVVCGFTNFLMAFVSQPISPEQAETLSGLDGTLLSTDICVDVEERGFMVTAELLSQDRDMLVVFVEGFIQYVQLASVSYVQTVSARVAWSLKSLLTILVDTEQLEASGLRTRVLKLIVFFLHYKDAIDMFATCTTSITELIWGPTIEQAKQGLQLASSLSVTEDLTPKQNSVIYKAKRAFVSLEIISAHPRACERLMDSNVLQIVDIALIPSGDIMQKTAPLLAMYALFGRFIAALSRRTAFVRTRLRDECGLFPIILKLSQQAIEHREMRDQDDAIRVGWTQVVSSCLLVVSSFQYDESSMKMWLCWDYGDVSSTEVRLEDDAVEEEMVESQQVYSILPSLLAVLFPGNKHISESKNDHFQLLFLAANVLDQLSAIPVCGRQMIQHPDALADLASLMVTLTKDHFPGNPDKKRRVQYEDKMDDAEVNEEEGEAFMSESPRYQCAEYLRKSAIRILTCHDNIQYTILADAFTTFFKPLLQHPSYRSSSQHWRTAVVKDLYTKKLPDFVSLFKFTEVTDHAIKLYEFTAVAVAYSIMGTGSDQEWNSVLGLGAPEIVSSKYVFGVLCQMLMYELEYEETHPLLKIITPFRRNAAAQVIETLALELEVLWRVEIKSIASVPVKHVVLAEPHQKVYFATDDSTELVCGNRQLLSANSPIFEALLGSNYAEQSKLESATAIPLHDVPFKSLSLFLSVMEQLNNDDHTLIKGTEWKDVIDLLLISDRFGTSSVKNKCQDWVLAKVEELHDVDEKERLVCLEGLLCLYRECRDPIELDGGITSKTWPFALVLKEAVKSIVMYLSLASRTDTFNKMVLEKDEEELSSLCDGISFLLKK